MIREALAYARLGLRVFAIRPRAKTPATVRGCLDGTTDPTELQTQWSDPACNIGIAAGSESGVFVLDVDGELGAATIREWVAEHGQLPTTPTCITSRGVHFYFRHPGDQVALRNSASKAGPGIDVRTDGGYVVAPPSVHPSGDVYAWEAGASPGEVEFAPAPDWLLRKLVDKPKPAATTVYQATTPGIHTPYGQRALDAECMELARAAEGGRNARLNAVAFRVGQLVESGHLDESSAVADLRRSALACGLEERETQQTIASGLKAGKASPNASDPNPREREVQRARQAQDYARSELEDPKSAQRDQQQESSQPKPREASLTTPQVVAHAMMYLGDEKRRKMPRSGFERIDSAIGGFPPGAMIVYGGRTGSGKSSLLLATALNIANESRGELRHKVGIISCEDPEWLWGARVLSAINGVDQEEFFRAQPQNPETAELCKQGLVLAQRYGVHFRFAIGKNPSVIVRMIEDLIAEGCTVIGVDYLQAISAKGQDRYVARTDAAQELKGVCHDRGAALILCSQLRRAEGGNPFREPTNAELKDSGDIENMAEAIVLLWPTSDAENATVLGKVTKVKWNPRRPKFQVNRNPSSGAIAGLIEPPAEEAPKQTRGGFMASEGGRWPG